MKRKCGRAGLQRSLGAGTGTRSSEVLTFVFFLFFLFHSALSIWRIKDVYIRTMRYLHGHIPHSFFISVTTGARLTPGVSALIGSILREIQYENNKLDIRISYNRHQATRWYIRWLECLRKLVIMPVHAFQQRGVELAPVSPRPNGVKLWGRWGVLE